MWRKVLFLSILVSGVISRPDNQLEVKGDRDREAKLGILGTSTLAQLAQDLFARSTTSSQVLSLNLTNLVILLVVKALIFGAGHLGLGGGGDHLGRSTENSEEENFVSESDLLLMLGYMKGDLTQKYNCLNFAACQDPRKAKQYFTASNLLVKGASMFNLVEDSKRYEKMLEEVGEAIEYGASRHDCSIRYTCKDKS